MRILEISIKLLEKRVKKAHFVIIYKVVIIANKK